jgi:hypothetical protein
MQTIQAMRKLKLSNYLFLIPALVIGPVLLLLLICHGLILTQYDRLKRWYAREVYSARILPMNLYLARQIRRR